MIIVDDFDYYLLLLVLSGHRHLGHGDPRARHAARRVAGTLRRRRREPGEYKHTATTTTTTITTTTTTNNNDNDNDNDNTNHNITITDNKRSYTIKLYYYILYYTLTGARGRGGTALRRMLEASPNSVTCQG